MSIGSESIRAVPIGGEKAVTERPSVALQNAIHIGSLPLMAMSHKFWTHPSMPQLVIPFLTFMHQIVRASVPLMEAASRRAAKLAPSDELSRLLQEYMDNHIEEERDHDVWILEDLASAGVDTEKLLNEAPPPTVASLVGAQYYWIYHYHPVALLGYIRLLEGSPPEDAHIDRIQSESGLPESLFRTYRLHGQLDPNHIKEIDAVLDSLPLSTGQMRLIESSAIHTAQLVANRFIELMRIVERAK